MTKIKLIGSSHPFDWRFIEGKTGTLYLDSSERECILIPFSEFGVSKKDMTVKRKHYLQEDIYEGLKTDLYVGEVELDTEEGLSEIVVTKHLIDGKYETGFGFRLWEYDYEKLEEN